MSTTGLQRFVEDELLRAPMVIDMTMQGVFEALQRGPAILSGAERQVAAEIIMRLGAHRATVAAGYLKSLRQQAVDELGGRVEQAPLAMTAKSLDGLALVEEEDVAVDVATSHTIETIKSVAEAELRELLTYTSALANDMDVTRDHNPLRAEAQARALWFAAQGLPLGRAHQLAFMRLAAMPFAQALRKNFAAACSRLDEQGVEPAAYRTLILPRGPRRAGSGGPQPPSGAYAHRSLEERADAVSPFTSSVLRPYPGPPPAPTPAPTHLAPPMYAPASAPVAQHASVMSDADAHVAGLVDQLYETILTDRRLPAEMQAPLLRMQACTTKAAQLNEGMLDQFGHPLWRFIDLLAHEAVIHPGAKGIARAQLITFANKLIDQLVQETRHTEPLYVWAIERLDRYVAKRLAQTLSEQESRIASMQALEDRIAADNPVSTMSGIVDVEQLDTVPADLMESQLQSEPPDRAMTSARWLLERRSGDWLRVFRKGQWRHAHLLWPGDRGEFFLFADGDTDECWVIRRGALLSLRDSKLASMAWPRSLVTDAKAILVRKASRASA
jgi:Protein of unknown function (DUF1631)